MADLLEDPDGAPYPESVQTVVEWLERGIDDLDAVDARADLVTALEEVGSVLRQREEPRGDIEKMRYWADRVINGDDTSAGGSMDLDYAHDELTQAARSYLKTPTLDEAMDKAMSTREWVAGMAFGVPVEARGDFLRALFVAAGLRDT